MSSDTYGLGPAGRQTTGRGQGLAGTASDRTAEAMSLMGQVAAQDTEREMQNKQARAAKKQGTLSLGISGAATGATVGGPWGAVIGGVVGLAAGSLF